MDLNLTDDQELLRQTTHKFLTANWSTSAVRELIGDPIGFDRDVWTQGAELGWTAFWDLKTPCFVPLTTDNSSPHRH